MDVARQAAMISTSVTFIMEVIVFFIFSGELISNSRILINTEVEGTRNYFFKSVHYWR